MFIIEVIKARPDSNLSEQRSFEEVIVIDDNHTFGAAPAPPPRGQKNNHNNNNGNGYAFGTGVAGGGVFGYQHNLTPEAAGAEQVEKPVEKQPAKHLTKETVETPAKTAHKKIPRIKIANRGVKNKKRQIICKKKEKKLFLIMKKP